MTKSSSQFSSEKNTFIMSMVSPPGDYFIRRLDSATAPFRSAHFNADYFLLLFYFFPPHSCVFIIQTFSLLRGRRAKPYCVAFSIRALYRFYFVHMHAHTRTTIYILDVVRTYRYRQTRAHRCTIIFYYVILSVCYTVRLSE